MPVHFTLRAERVSELGADTASLRHVAAAAERSGFDRILIADPDGSPRSVQVASFVLHGTTSLEVAVTHAVGPMAPTVAAEQFSALNQLSGGRVALWIVPGSQPASNGEPPLDHERSLSRTDEYLVLLKRLWASDRPFDYEGTWYSLKGDRARDRPFGDTIPLALSGLSGTALQVAGRHADIFALPAASMDQTRQTIDRVRQAAARYGRGGKVAFSLDIMPVIADTREAAWAMVDESTKHSPAARLVGTPDQVALALLDYCEFGVSNFVVHGEQAAGGLFSEAVMPIVRRSVSRHERASEGIALAAGASGFGPVHSGRL